MRRVVVIVVAVLAIAASELLPGSGGEHAGHAGQGGLVAQVRTALAQAAAYLQQFTGRPPSPQPWQPTDWDVSVHSRDTGTWLQLEPMTAQHGPDCAGPPATHPLNGAYADAVFICNDHLMTAINAGGYGVIYLTPNRLVDFSAGEAVVRFDMSTRRTSGRDWVDLWISPYADHLQLPLQDWLPDLQGEPRRAVQVRMDNFNGTSIFRVVTVSDHGAREVNGNTFTGYETFLVPDAARRDTFELRISRTRLKFGMPAYNFWWVDTTIPDLGWDQGVVQLGHHSYNPTKDCVPSDNCQPNTWHWDNVRIEPAIPFTILRADRRYVDRNSPATVQFPAPSPAGSHLRFSAIGTPQYSLDGGATWQTAQRQTQELNDPYHFASYWTPIPTGITAVQLRGTGNSWMIKDISIWSLQGDGSSPPAPTPLPPEACVNRPRVAVSATPAGPGRLQVTLTAGTSALAPSNALRQVRFGAASNALIDAGSQVGRSGSFSLALPSSPSQFSFTVRRATAGVATTVPLTVVDGCGDWPTFVGGGPNAF